MFGGDGPDYLWSGFIERAFGMDGGGGGDVMWLGGNDETDFA